MGNRFEAHSDEVGRCLWRMERELACSDADMTQTMCVCACLVLRKRPCAPRFAPAPTRVAFTPSGEKILNERS